MCSLWCGRRLIHLSAVAIDLLRFGPFCQETLCYCFVLSDGKWSSEWLKKIKSMLKEENEVVKKPTAPGAPRRSPIQVLSKPDDA